MSGSSNIEFPRRKGSRVQISP